MFRKMRGVHLPPDKQGYLFFLCRNYKDLPEESFGYNRPGKDLKIIK